MNSLFTTLYTFYLADYDMPDTTEPKDFDNYASTAVSLTCDNQYTTICTLYDFDENNNVQDTPVVKIAQVDADTWRIFFKNSCTDFNLLQNNQYTYLWKYLLYIYQTMGSQIQDMEITQASQLIYNAIYLMAKADKQVHLNFLENVFYNVDLQTCIRASTVYDIIVTYIKYLSIAQAEASQLKRLYDFSFTPDFKNTLAQCYNDAYNNVYDSETLLTYDAIEKIVGTYFTINDDNSIIYEGEEIPIPKYKMEIITSYYLMPEEIYDIEGSRDRYINAVINWGEDEAMNPHYNLIFTPEMQQQQQDEEDEEEINLYSERTKYTEYINILEGKQTDDEDDQELKDHF